MRFPALAVFAVLAAASPAAQAATPETLPAPPTAPWASPLARDHALVGTFWRTDTWQPLTPAEVVARAVESRAVIVGERHDNADHHALQAWLTKALAAQGRRPAIVYEMMGVDAQPAIDAWRQDAPTDAEALGAVLEWQTSGWPEWPLYAPMAATAVEHGLPILAGNLSRETVRALARAGLDAAPGDLAETLALRQADRPEIAAALVNDVRAGHCDLMPEAALAPMAMVQRARDAMMARRLLDGLEAPGTDSALLITGNGHAREDRGVPYRLSQWGLPRDAVLTVAPLEVDEARTQAPQYASRIAGSDGPVYDIVWFSPRWDDIDHCAALRERMKNANQ